MDFIEISCVNWISCLNHTGREKSVVAALENGGSWKEGRVKIQDDSGMRSREERRS